MIQKFQNPNSPLKIQNPREYESQRYNDWLKMSWTDKIKRKLRIAKSQLERGPAIQNIGRAIYSLFGGYTPENPYLSYGVAPSPAKPINPKGVISLASKAKTVAPVRRVPTTAIQTTQARTNPRSLMSESPRFGDDYKQISIEDVQKLANERLGRNLTKTELTDYINQKKVDLTGDGIGFAPRTAEGVKDGTIVIEEKDIPEAITNLERFASPSTIRTRMGNQRYTQQEIEQMIDEAERLKPNVALQRVEPGSHGVSNWHDRMDTPEDNIVKYLKTKYGPSTEIGMMRDNPYDRSGVLVKAGDFDYSFDSFGTALKYLDRVLGKKGRQFFKLNPEQSFVRSNNYGQRGRYEEMLLDSEFDKLLKSNRGELPEGSRVIKLNNGTLAVQQADGKVVMKLRPKSNQEIIDSYTETIDNLNKNYNLNIQYPKLNEQGKILWPNIYGILFKNGGILNYLNYVPKNI